MLAAIAAAVAPGGIPRDRVTVLTLGSLAALAAWTLLSLLWAPIAGNAYGAGQIVVLYLGALAAATMVLRWHPAQRWVEPAMAAGALIVIGYGLSERLLPGLLTFARSVSAQGRLEQPLTYWNAMGELAAIGFVLSARLAGSDDRPRWLRAAAAAAAAPLGLGLYISFSRGALFACVAGLVALIVLAPRREQLTAILVTVSAGVLAAVAAAPFKEVTGLSGGSATREQQGVIALALVAAVIAVAFLVSWRLVPRERPAELKLPRHAASLALAVICVGLAIAIVSGAKESSTRPLSGGASRLTTLQSNRYAYWRVALRAFGDQPLRGVGAGGWAVYWLRYRPIAEGAQDAHSLPLQTLAELGVVGLALLGTFLGGVTWAAVDALRAARGVAAGPIAGGVVYLAHAPLDWDWQMPAVTLVALVLAGALLALAGGERSGGDVAGVSTGPRRSAALPA